MGYLWVPGLLFVYAITLRLSGLFIMRRTTASVSQYRAGVNIRYKQSLLRRPVLTCRLSSLTKVCSHIRKHTFDLQTSNHPRPQHQRTLSTSSNMLVLHVQRVILATLAMLPPQGSPSNNHWSAVDNPPGISTMGHRLDPGSTSTIPFGLAGPTSKPLAWPGCNINDRDSVVIATSRAIAAPDSSLNATIDRLLSAARGIGEEVFKLKEDSEVWSAWYGTSVSPIITSALALADIT